ncbi:hypothetical protein CSC94_07405 [Zhengella mangrovi]|uniref:Uncharacterized protein n=1 Tax=Zhengella mangrovi TaxID=1982044 RepID=A0A2G1QPV7_9HYPH|nr:hypothetical protein [Zhengella mangrovi]PHP67525.1 hypothetical protein CSC94_07405 [Zhengella mangrovi]
MKKIIIATLALVSFSGTVFAASLTNKDADPRTIIVTEGGSKGEISVNAGESVSICPNGCFLTMPNGDREALKGDETIDISNGKAVFR